MGLNQLVPPTAHASVRESVATPMKQPSELENDWVQAVPFQCTISDESGWRPAAQTLLASVAATLYRRPGNVVNFAGPPALGSPVLAALAGLASPAMSSPAAVTVVHRANEVFAGQWWSFPWGW